jgi:isoamylase
MTAAPPLLLLFNPGPEGMEFALPPLGAWHPWLDTARTPSVARLEATAPAYPLAAESLVLLALGAASPAEIANDFQ